MNEAEQAPAFARGQSGFAVLRWAHSMRSGLTPTTKLVLTALAFYANQEGVCFPSIHRIAADTRLSERACQKAIPDLEVAGFLKVNRNSGRGHSSVYTLNVKRPVENLKGERGAPISHGERVNDVHPLVAEKVNVVHPLQAKRVNVVRLKGERGAPQLTKELSKQAAMQFLSKPRRAKSPQNPRRSDPPERWHHLADRHPDGSSKTEVEQVGGGIAAHAIVAGWHLDVVADMVCKAAGITDPKWRGNWQPVIAWLRDGLDLHGAILPTIRRVAARPSYAPPVSLAYFDKAVREAAAKRLPQRRSDG